ncbi:hypothetical protein Q0F98_05815 [Paenibacillus amylolyticus]|nr:hypothetical protein Q0F98_05815 [Paenibacillus amylolyticus]
MRPDFSQLPFNERPDLSPYLIHLTKNTIIDDKYSAFDNLVSILKTGEIWGSTTKRGFVKGKNTAACFMDIPFSSLKYVINKENSSEDDPRYQPYGVAFTKEFGYNGGCRPVLYLSNKEALGLGIPQSEIWRVVRFEKDSQGWINWLHEREWRSKGNFQLPNNAIALVRRTSEVKLLNEMIHDEPEAFKVKPRAILPLHVVCQGLIYL